MIFETRYALGRMLATRGLWTNPVNAFRFFARQARHPSDHERRGRFRFRGVRFDARSTDWCAVQEIMLRDEYGFIAPLLEGRASPRVIDLGANIGMFGVYVLGICPDARVFSLEASPQTFKLLTHNRHLNPGADWQVRSGAAWKEDGTVSFDDREFSTNSRIDRQAPATLAIPALSLATLLAPYHGKRIDLMKVDIEGAEEALLCGAERLLEQVQHLVVEIHPDFCDGGRVLQTLRRSYPHLLEVPGRGSGKPLLLATRDMTALPEAVAA